MSNIVFAPEILFANVELWETDKCYKDKFIERLFGILEYINSNNDYFILWSNECEKVLWDFPNQAPWRTDKDFKNQSVVAINNFLHKSQLLLCSNLDKCITFPLISEDQHSEYVTEILKIMHLCLHENRLFDLCILNNEKYDIICPCNFKKVNPKIITCKEDFVTYELY